MDIFHQSLYALSPLGLRKEPCDFLLPPALCGTLSSSTSHSSHSAPIVAALDQGTTLAHPYAPPHMPSRATATATSTSTSGSSGSVHTTLIHPTPSRQQRTPNHPDQSSPSFGPCTQASANTAATSPGPSPSARNMFAETLRSGARSHAPTQKPNGSPLGPSAPCSPHTHTQVPTLACETSSSMQGADSKGSPDAKNTRKQSCIGAPLLAAKGVSGWSDISDERGPAQPSLTLFAKQSFISLYADTGAVLGQGVTGEIRVCMRNSDHRSFAYKVLPFGLDSVREMRIWQSLLPHPNIVPLVDAFDELVLPGHPLAKYVSGGQGGRVIIAVMPRMEHDLLSLVRHRSLSDDEVREITRQILAGVAHMHANGFVHNDIKLENVLVVPATMCTSGLHDIGTTTPVSACDTGDTCDTCDDAALMDHKKGVLASGLRALVSRADPSRDVCSCCDGRAPSPAGFYQPEHAPSPTPGPASDADDRSDHGTAVVGQRLRVVLCDFGFARSANSPFLSSFTRAYISPEALTMLDQRQHRIALAQNVRVAAARDVWAVGVLVFVLHTRRLPFHELPGEDRRAHRSGITPNMRHTISRGIYTIPKTLSGPACAFLHHVLVVDPRIRPMAATLLLHPWLLGDHVDP